MPVLPNTPSVRAPSMDLMIEDLMEQLVNGGGSDLHIASGQPPYGRFSGELRPMQEEPLSEEGCNRLIFSMLNNSQRKTLEQTWELDCAYGLKGVARFRVNVYRQKGSYAACLRALGSKRNLYRRAFSFRFPLCINSPNFLKCSSIILHPLCRSMVDVKRIAPSSA